MVWITLSLLSWFALDRFNVFYILRYQKSYFELGRYPLHYDIAKTILKYCYRLENLSTEFPLLQDAFLFSKKLHYMNKTSWYSSVTKLLKIFNIQDTMHLNKSKFGQSLRQSLVKKYLLDWQRSDGKLVTYLFLKTIFGLKKYLALINNFNYRKSICRFRV